MAHILREKFLTPVKYEIIRSEGAKVRAGYSLNSQDLGFCPQHTIIEVDETRLIKDDGDYTTRLHIISPVEWTGSWLSEKNHIVKKLTSNQDEVDKDNLEKMNEMNRRVLVRSQRGKRVADKSLSVSSHIGSHKSIPGYRRSLITG